MFVYKGVKVRNGISIVKAIIMRICGVVWLMFFHKP